tara:strand:+ start:1042 stop:1212 length:171 start_codon:yes stop_codon:yes gene_type:complete
MQISDTQYNMAGFLTSGSIGIIHFQDFLMAIAFGFFGALGAYIFQRIVNRNRKKRD